MWLSRPFGAVLSLVTLASLAACGSEEPADNATEQASDQPLVIYSGRNEELVGGILDQLEKAVGVPVEVRYASSSELAAQLLEEGEQTDADLFFSQDAGALGAVGGAGLLAPIDGGVTDAVDAKYKDAAGLWVATSARARVIAYSPELAPDIVSATGVDAILQPAYKGKIGYAPTNASFHAFVTALRVDRGEDGARQWLTDFKAQEPEAFEGNDQVLAAVDSGQVALGLINHYYWYQLVAENGAENVTAKIHFLDSDDPGALINVAGVGVIAGSDQADAAGKAVEFLLSDTAQQYFADETAEYPVVAGITSGLHELPALDELSGQSLDLNDLDSLETTLTLLDEVGLT